MGCLDSSLQAYLRLRFVPDAQRATEYVRWILSSRDRVAMGAPQLLCAILEEMTWSKGYREVAIPLTGGYDSRSLLGAALEVFPPSAIRCLTIGVPSFPDCVGAAAACRRVGVSHELVDSNGLEWDIDRLIEMARDRFRTTGACVTPETLMGFGALAERVGNGVPVLSGFMGGSASGVNVSADPQGRLSVDGVVLAFLRQNRSILDGAQSPELKAFFREFVEAHAEFLDGRPGAVPGDLLDLGFRQRLYLRPNSAAFPSVVYPYEDPRWVNYWLSRPLEDRIGQAAYTREMPAAFAQVFGSTARPPRQGVLRGMVPGPMRHWIRAVWRGEALSVPINRADPRTNTSVRRVFATLLDTFDGRQLLPFRMLPVLQAVMRRFDHDQFSIVRWAVSAELHLRAGNLAP
jgi:hypothetical protein